MKLIQKFNALKLLSWQEFHPEKAKFSAKAENQVGWTLLCLPGSFPAKLAPKSQKIHKWLNISIILLMNNKRQYSPDQRNGTLWFNCNWSVWMKLSHAYCIHQWCNSLSLSLSYQNIKFYTRYITSTQHMKRRIQGMNRQLTNQWQFQDWGECIDEPSSIFRFQFSWLNKINTHKL